MKTGICLVLAALCFAMAFASEHSDNMQGATFHGFIVSVIAAAYFW